MGTILLCLVGLFLGIVVFKLESLQSIRGNLAGWFLVAFGLLYFLWGAWHALRAVPHGHTHFHAGGHSHSQVDDRGEGKTKLARVTPWLLFVFFILGPCEPLIPLITYQSAELNFAAASIVALTFWATTVLTMLGCVMALLLWALSSFPASFLRKIRPCHQWLGNLALRTGYPVSRALRANGSQFSRIGAGFPNSSFVHEAVVGSHDEISAKR